jgi:hypothetical protein
MVNFLPLGADQVGIVGIIPLARLLWCGWIGPGPEQGFASHGVPASAQQASDNLASPCLG